MSILSLGFLAGPDVHVRGIFGLQTHLKGETNVSYCCIENLWVAAPGEDAPEPDNFPGCFDSNPLLSDVLSGDLQLTSGSPCIDAGDSLAFPADVLLDLAVRPESAGAGSGGVRR